MRRNIKKIRKVKKDCPFCKEKLLPDYKQPALLEKYLSERGKILSSAKTGICAKHQRRVAVAIKRARFIGLLPFTASVH